MPIESVEKVPSLAGLFLSFLKLGAAAFGGPAMIAYIRGMADKQKNWIDDASFKNGVAFCQMVPVSTANSTSNTALCSLFTSAHIGYSERPL